MGSDTHQPPVATPPAETGDGVARVHVIGVGSPFADDWLGWELAERLRASEPLAVWRGQVSISLHDRPGPALLQMWRVTGLVILMDAVRSGVTPGTVHCFDAARLAERLQPLATPMSGVAGALQVAAARDALPGALHFFGIEADPENTALHVSDAVLAALPAAVMDIENLIDRYLEEYKNGSVPGEPE